MKLHRAPISDDDYGVFSVVKTRLHDCENSAAFVHLHVFDWVNVVAVDSEGRLLLVRQFRVGVDELTIELPGGIIDEGVIPMQCAKEELAEECFFKADAWYDAGHYYPNPALQNNKVHSFVCVDARPYVGDAKVNFPKIETMAVDPKEFASLLDAGHLQQAFFYTSMLLASRCLQRHGRRTLDPFMEHIGI